LELSLRITSDALILRWSSGFRLIDILPLFKSLYSCHPRR
jgi:hypothetical protein